MKAFSHVRRKHFLPILLVALGGPALLLIGLLPAFSPLSARAVSTTAGTWSSAGSLPVGLLFASATLLPDGRVLVAGGLADDGSGRVVSTSATELYDPATNSWSAGASMTTPRSRHQAVLLANGHVLVAGGRDASNNSLRTAELYDPASNTWTPTGSMLDSRGHFTATILKDGRVLVAGGNTNLVPPGVLKEAEIYDPATGTWTRTGNMVNRRFGHQAILLPNGDVLVAGGAVRSDCQDTRTAELYDPATGQWTPTAPMATARSFFGATLLLDGKVLAFGGSTLPAGGKSPLGQGPCFVSGEKTTAAAELYDAATGTWSPTGSMGSPRGGIFTGALLFDGEVLAAGGVDGDTGLLLASAERYDPATGTWSATGSLATARAAQMWTHLADGRVLVVGGGDNSGNLLATAEVYTP